MFRNRRGFPVLASLAVLGLVGAAAFVGVSRLSSNGLAAAASCGAPGHVCHISSTGSDGNPCTAAAPCRNFDRAYHAAEPGGTVRVAPGSYGTQKISRDARRSSPAHVVFEPAGAAPVLRWLDIYGDHVTVKNMKVATWVASGTDITLRNLQSKTFLTSAHRLSLLGGEVGNYAPFCASGSRYPAMDNATVSPINGQTPTDIVIRGVTFHDFSSANCPASHMDCLQVAGAIRLTISGNKFYRCQVQDLILTGDFGVMDNITVERNWFGPTVGGGESMDWNPTRDCPRGIVRYNTFAATGLEFDCSRDRSAEFYGNLVPRLSDFDCGTKRAIQHDNVGRSGVATATCGRGSRIVPNATSVRGKTVLRKDG